MNKRYDLQERVNMIISCTAFRELSTIEQHVFLEDLRHSFLFEELNPEHQKLYLLCIKELVDNGKLDFPPPLIIKSRNGVINFEMVFYNN